MITQQQEKNMKETEEQGEYDDDELSLSQKILDKEQIEDLKRYQEQLAQAEETTEEETEPETEMEKDETFYTRSMDLSEEDFDLDTNYLVKNVSDDELFQDDYDLNDEVTYIKVERV